MKKWLAVLMSVVLLAACVPMGAVSVAAATSGTTGDCTWVLNGTHLTISGNGKMGSYNSWGNPAPWGTDITSVIIEYGVTTIGDCAFYSCTSLNSVTIPDSVTTIGEQAFRSCYALSSVTIPDSVTNIEDYTFDDCTSLTTVTIGKGVTTIGECAFSDCTSLTTVTIGKGITTIRGYAFAYCTSLTTVTISKGITFIGDFAFIYCNALTDVYYGGTKEDRNQLSFGYSNYDLINATWHYNYKPEPEVAYGDSNGDGRINNKDLGLLQQYLAGWDVELNLDACDVNSDGRVNNRDLGLLQQYLADWDVTLG